MFPHFQNMVHIFLIWQMKAFKWSSCISSLIFHYSLLHAFHSSNTNLLLVARILHFSIFLCPHVLTPLLMLSFLPTMLFPKLSHFSLPQHCLVNSYVSARSQIKGNFLQEAFMELDVPPLFLIIPYDINTIPISITKLWVCEGHRQILISLGLPRTDTYTTAAT